MCVCVCVRACVSVHVWKEREGKGMGWDDFKLRKGVTGQGGEGRSRGRDSKFAEKEET